eukprot:5145160-Amphidinium_carterae.2
MFVTINADGVPLVLPSFPPPSLECPPQKPDIHGNIQLDMQQFMKQRNADAVPLGIRLFPSLLLLLLLLRMTPDVQGIKQ